MQEDAEKI